jgi:hypothetical protein
METPPPYNPPRKKSSTGLIIGLVLGGVAICCIGGIALALLAGYFGWKVGGPVAECALGFTEVQKAMHEYLNDHNGTFPKAETWQDEIRPYYVKVRAREKDAGPFKLWDPQGVWGCKNGSSTTGIAFNSKLSGKKLSDIEDKPITIMLFEVETARTNANEPFKPRDDKVSPTIMGEPRGWIKIPVEGEMIMQSPGKSSKFGTTGD